MLFSFVYTDKVFSSAKEANPVMKEITDYKKKNNVKPIEPTIKDDEIILGYAGISVNVNKSYDNMKKESKFDKEKIVYDTNLPDKTINNNYSYYIKKGNGKVNAVSLIFKVSGNANVSKILKRLNSIGINATFFVDGLWLENNIDSAFKMVNYGNDIYNLGYDEKYDKNMIQVTNKLIESITLKDSTYCLNNDKNDVEKEVCAKKKMYSLLPTMTDPTISELKSDLDKGIIISYDVNMLDINTLSVIIKTITSRGYSIKPLENIFTES